MRVTYVVGLVVAVAATAIVSAGAPETPLLEAARHGDVEAVRALLKGRVDVNSPEADGTTALHWATDRDDLAMVQVLLRSGASASAKNRYGATPLTAACVNGNAQIIEALLAAGADANTASPDGETVLMTVSRTGNVAAVKALLARGAKVDLKESLRGQTAVMWAAAENHAAAIRALVAAGASITERSNGGFTPLLFAVRAGQTDAVKALLELGANVNETLQPTPPAARAGAAVVPPPAAAAQGSAAGRGAVPPPLPEAAPAGLAGQNRRTMPGSGTSALIIAITNGNFELAALLLDRGADPNADAQGWSALHQVAFTRRPPNVKGLPPPVPSGNLDTLALAKALIAHGADPNGRMKKEPGDGHRTYMISRIGATPFLNAARGTDVDLMRVLKEGGANPSLTTDEGTTPLMIAAGVGIWKTGESAGTNEEALQAVKLAWELGNDVNVVDKRGNTAMHGAALRGSPEIVRFLVSKGAKTDVTNKIGWTPLTIAEGVLYPNTFSRSFETAAALRELGAKDAGKRRPEDMPPSEVFSEATKAAQQPK